MKIESIYVYDFSLPLVQPFSVGGESITHREGVIVQVTSDQGVMGFGEGAPLPGLSTEPLKKTVHQLSKIKDELKGREVPLEGKELEAWLAGSFSDDLVCPSTRFAIESAIFMMVSRARGMTLCEFLASGSQRAVPVAGLLQGTLSEVVDQARRLKVAGHTMFKLKVGNRNIPLDVQKVEDVRQAIGIDGLLRLDANRAWRFDEAVLFAQSIGKNQIEFIEEPCAQIELWEDFFRRTDMSFAVDDSFAQRSFDEWNSWQGLACFVIKPMVWGGITGALRLIRDASREGRRVVISSSFESGVGLTALANLALLTTETAGLGTANWFADDLLGDPLISQGGIIPVPKLTFTPESLRSDFKQILIVR